MTPKNVFVANFIGESNFLEGYASTAVGENTTIELREGVKVQINKNVNKEKRVVLAIRPETIMIERKTKKKENSVSGVVERVTFEGTDIRYEIRLESKDLVTVVKPSLIGEWLNIGEAVTVSFPPEKINVFSYPKSGLKMEIAVE